jgi:hypothetical protein
MNLEKFNGDTIYCAMCTEVVPEDRVRRRSITCGDECAKARTRWLHRRTARRKCRYCMQPATPEEQISYKRWRKAERDQAKLQATTEPGYSEAYEHDDTTPTT